MKRARIVDNVAVDVVSGDPAAVFTPDLAAQFVAVPDDVEAGWVQLQVIVGTALGQGLQWMPPRSFIEEYLPGAFRYAQREAASPAAAPALTTARHITELAFRNRFQFSEKVAIELAAADNPAAPSGQRQAQASLRAYLADARAATYIDLDRPDTRTGVLQLEQLGLLGPGRALEILDAPVQQHEVFRP